MQILVRKYIRNIFHEEGVNRVSERTIESLNDAVEEVVREIAKDMAKAYPKKLVESAMLTRISEIVGGYKLKPKTMDDDINVDDLLKSQMDKVE